MIVAQSEPVEDQHYRHMPVLGSNARVVHYWRALTAHYLRLSMDESQRCLRSVGQCPAGSLVPEHDTPLLHINQSLHSYTVQKKTHYIFGFNFTKCWSIFKILSLSESVVNFL